MSEEKKIDLEKVKFQALNPRALVGLLQTQKDKIRKAQTTDEQVDVGSLIVDSLLVIIEAQLTMHAAVVEQIEQMTMAKVRPADPELLRRLRAQGKLS